MNIVLASASPRRRELLRKIEHEFSVTSSPAKEVVLPSPRATVMTNAVLKCLAVPCDSVVISADTGVFLKKRFFGKPTCEANACDMLNLLNHKRHRVITGVAIRYRGKNGKTRIKKFAVSNTVILNFSSQSEIEAYVATGSPMDKAGAYGIQDGIDATYSGDLDNIIGLPVKRLKRELNKIKSKINRRN